MSDGFAVDVAALGRHATALDELARTVRRAAAAGRPLDVGAYGLVGRLFAGAAIDAAAAGSAAVAELAAHGADLADTIRAAHADYADVEKRVVTTFGGSR